MIENLSCRYFCRSNLALEELKVMKGLQSCTDSIENVSVEQAAYYRGMSVMKGFDLAKYKRDVRSDLKKQQNERQNKK